MNVNESSRGTSPRATIATSDAAGPCSADTARPALADLVCASRLAVVAPLPSPQLDGRQLVALKSALARAYPALRHEAAEAIQLSLAQSHLDLASLDPDRTWCHFFGGAQSSGVSYNGWEHREPPQMSLTLTDMQLRNFPADFGGDPASLDANSGIYTQGPQASSFGAHNEVRLLTSELKTAVRGNDFYRAYRAKLKAFYDTHSAALAMVAEANVLDYALRSQQQRLLAVAQGATVQQAQARGLSDQALGMLSEAVGHADAQLGRYGTQAHVFDIDGYASRDMTWLQASDGHVVLIMPGDARPVREYVDLAAMRADVAAMAATATGRAHLERHFSMFNLRSSLLRWGVQAWIEAVGEGSYHERIACGALPVTGALFANQVARMRDTDLDNLRYLIRSNDNIALQELTQAIGAFNGVLGSPLTQAAELGLDLWEVSVASTRQDHDRATASAWKSAVNLGIQMVLTSMVGAGGLEMGEEGSAESVGPARQSSRGPIRLADGRVGYVLSPVDSPRLPAAVDVVGVPMSGEALPNSLGMLERTDIPYLYRAVSALVASTQDPERNGFGDSSNFAVPAMLEGPVVITAATLAGARDFASTAFAPQGYTIYEIDTHGLRAVSLAENVKRNPQGLDALLGLKTGTVEEWQANGTVVDNLGEGALRYDEVHLSNVDIPLSRIKMLDPVGPLDSGSSGSEPSSLEPTSLER